jgi:hypothetical protein
MDVLNSSDLDKMKRFIFGELSEEESQAIEEQLFLDSRFSVEMSSLENDLVDGYVQGGLDDDDRKRFAASLAKSPELQEHVRTARALKRVIEEEKAVSPIPPPGFFGFRSSLTRYAAAAAIILLTIGFFWLLYDGFKLRGDIALKQQSFSDRENEINRLQENITTNEEKIAVMQKELAERQGVSDELARQLEESKAELAQLKKKESMPNYGETEGTQELIAKVTSTDNGRGDTNIGNIKLSPKSVSFDLPFSTGTSYDHYEINIKGSKKPVTVTLDKCDGGKCRITLPKRNLSFSIWGIVGETGTRNMIGVYRLELKKKRN